MKFLMLFCAAACCIAAAHQPDPVGAGALDITAAGFAVLTLMWMHEGRPRRKSLKWRRFSEPERNQNQNQ